MLNIKTCLGVKVTTSKDNRVYTEIYYSESFPDTTPDGIVCVGVSVGVITTTKTFAIKPGDKFKALYDVGEFWNAEKRCRESRPVLAEIQVLSSK